MATVQKFEELKIWQIAREIAKCVYALTRCGEFAKDYGLKDQIQRAAVSIGSNIAEGFERDSNSELMKFLSYAKVVPERPDRNCRRRRMLDMLQMRISQNCMNC